MSILFNQEVRTNRAEGLSKGNGMRLVLVTLDTANQRTQLEVEFYNENLLAGIAAGVADGSLVLAEVFWIEDGGRVSAKLLPVIELSHAGNTLLLKVDGIGDYSTYTLKTDYQESGEKCIDPLFGSIPFKFRPGCFNNNCSKVEGAPEAAIAPKIDYLARDFSSFKHVLLNLMRDRVPGWEPTSEADLDQVLIDLLAADGDELSDFQDRVMNEAFFGRARKRVSLARYGRLMDYHIHQGNQAETWLAIEVKGSSSITVDYDFGVWTGSDWSDSDSAIFMFSKYSNKGNPGSGEIGKVRQLSPSLNSISFFDWGETATALEVGATQADVVLPGLPTEAAAEELKDLFHLQGVTHLVLEQKLNPDTGTANGVDVTARQLLELLPGESGAVVVEDPSTDQFFVRISWRQEDALRQRFCFLTECGGNSVKDVSVFTGNLVKVSYGRPYRCTFRAEGEALGPTDMSQLVGLSESSFEETKWGAICVIPESPLAYRQTEAGGEEESWTSLTVDVGELKGSWREQIDLIESKSGDQHFIVETDEEQVSRIRFGNGVNGESLPADEAITCAYQVGLGSAGNVGIDTITGFNATALEIKSVRNPFDVVDGCDPESQEEILRRVPLAYQYKQLRAVTLCDYRARAEELQEVSQAKASYSWTGSWRTVRVAIDPVGSNELDSETRKQITEHLDAVRLIGEDVEVRGARYVPLDIQLKLCVHHEYWVGDVLEELLTAFSSSTTLDGQLAFFHPDLWTFGQPLHASQIMARALSIEGVERVSELSMRRWNTGSGLTSTVISISAEDIPESIVDELGVDADEIIQVENNPDCLENGTITFELKGGRR